MAGSASGQDESNTALWLATRAGNMELFYPLGSTRCLPASHWEFKPVTTEFFFVVLGENAH